MVAKNKKKQKKFTFYAELDLLVWRSSRDLIGNKLTRKVTFRLSVLRLSCSLQFLLRNPIRTHYVLSPKYFLV